MYHGLINTQKAKSSLYGVSENLPQIDKKGNKLKMIIWLSESNGNADDAGEQRKDGSS